jgi:hypothetical protein
MSLVSQRVMPVMQWTPSVAHGVLHVIHNETSIVQRVPSVAQRVSTSLHVTLRATSITIRVTVHQRITPLPEREWVWCHDISSYSKMLSDRFDTCILGSFPPFTSRYWTYNGVSVTDIIPAKYTYVSLTDLYNSGADVKIGRLLMVSWHSRILM